MPLPHNVDVDVITLGVLSNLRAAIQGWMRGRPHDETAFLNRITELLFERHRYHCDVGLHSPVLLSAEVVDLHRRGTTSTDKFGSDLAVTIAPMGGRFVKTVFFQLKKSKACKMTLERTQLLDASIDPNVGARSFVFAVDELNQKARIARVSDLLDIFPFGQASKSFDSADSTMWSPVSPWLARWLSCEEAPSSDSHAAGNVEALLKGFSRQAQELRNVWGDDDKELAEKYDAEGYQPARAWGTVILDTIENETHEIFAPPPKG